MATYMFCVVVLTVIVTATHANYIGCFQDNSTRILEGQMTTGNMTVEKCVQRCSMENTLYAGVEYGNQCFCGSQLKPYAKVNETDCSYNCSGNSAQKCGGFWKISLYNTRRYLGCYTDSSNRILKGQFKSNKKMTTAKCINFCKRHRRAYALTQYSIQCFCGDSLTATNKLADSDCNYNCAGATSEKCGGFWKGSLYLVI